MNLAAQAERNRQQWSVLLFVALLPTGCLALAPRMKSSLQSGKANGDRADACAGTVKQFDE